MKRLERIALIFVSLIILAACGNRTDLPIPTRTRFRAFTLPPTWTPQPTLTRAPTRRVTKAPPIPTATTTPTVPPLPTLPTRTPTATLADPARSTINGIVLDALGKPMQDIKVELTARAARDQVLQIAVSGPDGRFALTRIVPGSYRLRTAPVSFRTRKCITTADTTIVRGGMQVRVTLRFASTCM